MDAQSDPVFMESGICQRLTNFLIDKPGRIIARVHMRPVLPTAQSTPIDGIAWYYMATIQNNVTMSPIYTNLLMWVTSGFLQIATPPADPFTDVFGNVSIVSGGITGFAGISQQFFIGKHVRSSALNEELIFVQDGGLIPLRFYSDQVFGTGFFRAGFSTPATTGSFINLTLSATGAGLTGTWLYLMTFYDERGRESSPSPLLAITLANQGTQIVITWATDPALWVGSNTKGAYVYRNVQGETSVQYRVANIPYNGTDITTTAGAGDFVFDPAATYDKSADATIIVGVAAPFPGENDPPNPASVVATFNDRLFLNDTTNNATLQISNTGSPVQFAEFPTLPTDGARLQIGTDQGDPIVALVPFGAVLGIFKRRGLFFLYGNSLADWQIVPVNLQPCIAPDSAVRCLNSIFFLSDDGVYAQSYQAGDVAQKVSSPIQPLLLSYSEQIREQAVAFFVDNRYHLIVSDIIFVFDFGPQAWCTYQFGQAKWPSIEIDTNAGAPPSTGSRCAVTLSQDTYSVVAGGATDSVVITNSGAFVTTYSKDVSWITLGTEPTYSGTLMFTVDANSGAERVGHITICGEVITVNQAVTASPPLGNCT